MTIYNCLSSTGPNTATPCWNATSCPNSFAPFAHHQAWHWPVTTSHKHQRSLATTFAFSVKSIWTASAWASTRVKCNDTARATTTAMLVDASRVADARTARRTMPPRLRRTSRPASPHARALTIELTYHKLYYYILKKSLLNSSFFFT